MGLLGMASEEAKMDDINDLANIQRTYMLCPWVVVLC